MLRRNNRLTHLPAKYRVAARLQLAKESKREPSLDRIAKLGWELYKKAEPAMFGLTLKADEENFNACPDGLPNGFRSW